MGCIHHQRQKLQEGCYVNDDENDNAQNSLDIFCQLEKSKEKEKEKKKKKNKK